MAEAGGDSNDEVGASVTEVDGEKDERASEEVLARGDTEVDTQELSLGLALLLPVVTLDCELEMPSSSARKRKAWRGVSIYTDTEKKKSRVG